jgi:chaperonin GroES
VQIRPLNDHVVVKPVVEEKTVAGIVLPDTAKDQLGRGEVVAVGSGRLLENGTRAPVEVRVGDVVLFAASSGMKFRAEHDEYLLLSETDILAVLTPAPTMA